MARRSGRSPTRTASPSSSTSTSCARASSSASSSSASPWRSASGRTTCCSKSPPGHCPATTKKLLTFGVTEPFTTTLTVSTYGALILSMPILIYQLYAYVLPAFSDTERRVVLPLLLAAPLLFLVGVAFAYFVVMPAAVKFLLNFNDGQFNIQVRARDYYSFFSTTMLAGGVVFELPLAILAVTRLGIVKRRAAALEPPLRVPGDRDRRRRAAGRRPGLDADRDGAPAAFSTS